MYRSGWGLKDPGQERILAVDIRREGFEWALAHSCPSHASPGMSVRGVQILVSLYSSAFSTLFVLCVQSAEYADLKARAPVRIQWDPERNIALEVRVV